MILRFAAPSLLFLLVHPFPLFGLEIPNQPQGTISDYAGMLSPSTRAQLEERLRQFEMETTNQVVVVTFPSLEGEVLEDFSIRLAEAWKIGQKGKDNGVILLIFKEDRAVRIEVGYGLEGALPDATCKLIIENEIVPRFRAGKFDEGITKAVEAVISATHGEYKPRTIPYPFYPLGESYFGFILFVALILGEVLPLLFLWIVFVFGGLIALFAFFADARALGVSASVLALVPLVIYFLTGRYARRSLVLSRRGSRGGGLDWSGGFGGGGFSGGGFSGGGGSFGGGGASGRW